MAKQILGKTVFNQGADDDSIVDLKSSDVAHGMTTIAETDSYFTAQKNDASAGGVILRGLIGGSTPEAIIVQGLTSTADATHSTAGRGAVRLSAALKSGTGVLGMGTGKTILSIDDNGTSRFLMDADGNSYQDVGTAWTNFDIADDVALLNVLSGFCSRQDDPLRGAFQQWLAVPENRDRLEALQLVTFNDGPEGDGSVFVNMSRLAMLHTGAIRQQAARIDRLETLVQALTDRLLPKPRTGYALFLPAGA